jgi:hypothetical protein
LRTGTESWSARLWSAWKLRKERERRKEDRAPRIYRARERSKSWSAASIPCFTRKDSSSWSASDVRETPLYLIHYAQFTYYDHKGFCSPESALQNCLIMFYSKNAQRNSYGSRRELQRKSERLWSAVMHADVGRGGRGEKHPPPSDLAS